MNLFKFKNRKGSSGTVKGAIIILSLAFLVVSVSYANTVLAANNVAGGNVAKNNAQNKVMLKILENAQKKNAAGNLNSILNTIVAEGLTAAMPMLDPAGIPHYFGPYPNYANSPMPTGAITDIVLDNGGSGYTAPNVTIMDVYSTGANATATATVTAGIITSINITNGGSGYSAPFVVITDTTGSGAIATATIGGTLSGGIRKFVDSLPGLGINGTNNLGQYIPVAIPDNTTYPGSDYYEIALVEYKEQMHSDLPPTLLRGYVQLETPTNIGISKHVLLNKTDGTPILKADGTQAIGVDIPHYMGPIIISQRDVPVRLKFSNLLPTGAGGDLFLPVDHTVMGAGMGPLDMPGMPGMKEEYTENRATLHLHGGFVTWISDGTPHQWTTPAGENTQYPQGVSVQYVPDMWFLNGNVIPNTVGNVTPPVVGATNKPDNGSLTFYYNNQQSARLMFYHDHSYGITRLNVYAGEAAPYLITDQVEKDLIAGTNITGVNPDLMKVLPDTGIPLVIQDKTFVDSATIAFQDPTWAWGSMPGMPMTGDLWYPHVYMPNQNPYDISGMNAFGRWHYGPWFWPPTTNIAHGPVANPYYDCYPGGPCNSPWEPPVMPGVPNVSMAMEAFMDTPVVNGVVYPYLEVEPKAYRFRILNAADDRFFNLQLYVADSNVITSDGRLNTEVKMVPAVLTPGFPADWPTDGREGGVPDPATAGPDFIQVGSEGGFLPAPTVIPNQPVDWNMDQTNFDMGVVNKHTLLLGTAERADVIIDFSKFAGKTLILYNDAPAPFPAIDARYDYYTGHPDLTSIGGTPTTQPGYGPNTRTIMQIRVSGTPGNLTLDSISVVSGGSGYSTPTIDIVGDGTGANATAKGSVDHISLNTLGSGYTAPVVEILGDGTGANATATVINGFITGITLTSGGSDYTYAPIVNISDPTGIGATAKSTLTVTGITLTNAGSDYTTATVVITDSTGTGWGAGATANLINPTAPLPYNVTSLNSVFEKTNTKKGVFEISQDPIIAPQEAYNSAYNKTFPVDAFVRIMDSSMTFQTISDSTLTIPLQPKAIQDEMGEAFEKEYGRGTAMLGLELPSTNAGIQNFLLYPYASPPVDIVDVSMTPMSEPLPGDGTQLWKITHNGVDTHTVHFHLFNVQLINRVAWDNALRIPDANELGWKETIRVNPLQDTIVALRPIAPTQPFDIPNSIRLIDPTMPEGEILTGGPLGFQDTSGEPVTVINHKVNFGWEYVYHCHLLAHEEMDMMHSLIVAVPPKTPSNLVATLKGSSVTLTWKDNSLSETGFIIQRAGDTNFTIGLTTFTVGSNIITYIDKTVKNKQTYYYRVLATNVVGDTTAYTAPAIGFPMKSVSSAPSNTVSITTK